MSVRRETLHSEVISKNRPVNGHALTRETTAHDVRNGNLSATEQCISPKGMAA